MNKIMQAVILAAGKGTRMRPLTYDIPKAMLPIKGRPVLEYTIDSLPEEIDEVIIVINHLGDQIKNHFSDVWKGRKIKYVLQEELNGTGGAVHSCKDLVKGKFMVVMGDDLYYKADLLKLAEEDLAIMAKDFDDAERFGIFETNEQGHLLNIIESPHTFKSGLINVGAYILNEKFFDYEMVPAKAGSIEFGLPQTLAKMAKEYPVKIIRATYWLPIGFPEDIQKAEEVIEKFV
jgi:UDP-N-acetylglucosamine diphosphorylase / glucose-1-phosphate thymidylyltransferase / UDP-N-acetylgalactosamine diphosphorylase / glucosamine-1-phosphate N-acetyltransferase / galactosamine-1-phosphate N-acetyltransferase